MTEIVRDVRRDVERIMGSRAGSLRVGIHPLADAELRALCIRSSRGARLLFDPSLEELPVSAWVAHAAHETAHACIRDEWVTLPRELEEGLCDLVALQLAPLAEEGMLEDIGPARRAGLEKVRALGVAGLRELAARARSEGHAEIPATWYGGDG